VGVDVAGSRLVLVDDTWTTGARAQSAASALAAGGAEVEAVVVLGRVVTPVAGAPTGGWWERHVGALRSRG
jgi:adenine/guanine phosphoribosyltransferase-like PRPP-binding protein